VLPLGLDTCYLTLSASGGRKPYDSSSLLFPLGLAELTFLILACSFFLDLMASSVHSLPAYDNIDDEETSQVAARDEAPPVASPPRALGPDPGLTEIINGMLQRTPEALHSVVQQLAPGILFGCQAMAVATLMHHPVSVEREGITTTAPLPVLLRGHGPGVDMVSALKTVVRESRPERKGQHFSTAYDEYLPQAQAFFQTGKLVQGPFFDLKLFLPLFQEALGIVLEIGSIDEAGAVKRTKWKKILERLIGINVALLGPNSTTNRQDIAFLSNVKIIAAAAVSATQKDSVVLWTTDAKPSHNGLLAIAEITAAVAAVDSPLQLSFYLHIVYDALKKAGIVDEDHRDDKKIGIETRAELSCKASHVTKAGFPDTFKGTDALKSSREAAPGTADPHRAPPPRPFGSSANGRGTNAPPEAVKKDIADVIARGSWKRGPLPAGADPNNLPRARDMGYTMEVRKLFPFYRATGWSPIGCAICGAESHKATECRSWGAINEGEPWWRLYEEALEKCGKAEWKVVPSERTSEMTCYLTGHTSKPRVH